MAVGDLTTVEAVKRYLSLSGRPITAITNANPGVVTCPAHDFATNTKVVISDVAGMSTLNGQTFTITPVDADHFSINLDTTALAPYVSGGFASPDDLILTDLITAFSGWIQGQMRRSLAAADYTEIHDGDGTNTLLVRHSPLLSVTSVTVNDRVIAQSTAWNVAGWVVQDDLITLRFDRFSEGVANVSIALRAGFETIPDAVSRACLLLVAWAYRERDRLGLKSRTTGGETVSYIVDGFGAQISAMQDAKDVIAFYKDPVI